MSSVFIVWAHRPTYKYIVSIHRSIGSAIAEVSQMRNRFKDTRYSWTEEILWP